MSGTRSVVDALTTKSLEEWAEANRDMVPHVETLIERASEAFVIVEFGVRGGVSTWAFLSGLPEYGRLYSVDIDDCTVPPVVQSDIRWKFLRGDDLDPAVQGQLPTHADLVFIDTSHEYEQTVGELTYALSLSPSVILCHDADWDGVERAINEFCESTGWKVTAFDEAGDDRGQFSLATLEPA
jgi:predicted O-methyltransferase YrrM